MSVSTLPESASRRPQLQVSHVVGRLDFGSRNEAICRYVDHFALQLWPELADLEPTTY
jgi:hypothetical protein